MCEGGIHVQYISVADLVSNKISFLHKDLFSFKFIFIFF